MECGYHSGKFIRNYLYDIEKIGQIPIPAQ